MAISDKNIRITKNTNTAVGIFPKIVFTGSSAGTSVVTLEVLDDNTVSFTSNEGQIFSLDSNLSTGTIWSVNDISGYPLLRADVGAASGATIRIAEGLGFVGIGQTNPNYKLDVKGWAGFASTGDGSYTALFENGASTGSNAFSIRAGNSLRLYNSDNSLFTAFRGTAATASRTYILPPTFPSTGTSVLQSDTSGNLLWAAMSAGSSSINSAEATSIAYYSNATTISGTTVASAIYFQYTGDTKGLVVANVDAEFNTTTGSTKLLTVGTGATNYSTARKTLAVISTNNAWTNGDLLILGVGKNPADVRLGVDWRGYVTLGTPGTGFTLPILNGTSGQVLTANTNGVASWTTVTGSSGAGSGTVAIPGAQYQVAAYYHSATGASVSGSTTFTNNTSTGVVNITHATESTTSTTGALTVAGGAGIAKSLFVGTTLTVGQAAGYSIPNVLGTFVSTVNSYNQLVIQNKSNGTSASANLVVNNDSSTDTTFYGEIGMNSSTFSGTGALGAPNATYVSATSGPLVLGTTTAHPIRFVVNGAATDVMYIAESGTAISIYTNLGMRSASDLRFWNSGNTFYAALQGGNNTANYTMTMPTAPVGAGASLIVVGSDSIMYFAAPGSGIAFSSATANTPLIRAKRPLNLQFCAGYTPAASGPDYVVLTIPDSPVDGTSQVTYRLRDFNIRVETPNAGSSRIQLEKSTGTGAFTATTYLGGSGLTISGAGTYVTTTTTFAGAFLTSGDNVRINWTQLAAGHGNFSVQLLLEEV